MRILRVFPRRTAMTPTDELAFVGDPPLFRPPPEEIDEVHVSCTFTWDRPEAERLVGAWKEHYPGKVRLGGPAIRGTIGDFVPGRYLRPGVTITSRGCPNRCPWCLVPNREGPLFEFPEIAPGHEIQDNNILACSLRHFIRVCEMLRAQRRAAIFSGGLDPRMLTVEHVERLQSLRIRRLFLAFDAEYLIRPVNWAIETFLRHGFERRRLRCYVLVGFGDDTIEAAEERLCGVWERGATPFAMLWRGPGGEGHYEPEWKALARRWSRDQVIHARMKAEAR